MKKLILFMLALCLGVAEANAQALSDLRLTVFGGGSFLAANRTFTADGEMFNTEFESGPRFGFRATASMTDRISFEGAYSFGKNNFRVTNLRTIPVSRLFEMSNHQFSANGMYYLSGLAEDWKPFVTAGIGITRFSPTQEASAFAALRFLDDPANIRASNQFGVNFGGGAEYQLSNSLGARFDVRDHVMAIPRFNVAQSPTGSGSAFFPVSGQANNLEFSAGLVFYLR